MNLHYKTEMKNMKDIKGNTLKIGDYVVFVHGKNSTASLKTGTITKIYHGRFQEECSVDGNPHILQNRVMKLEKMEE